MAITEYYISAAGGGAHDGTTEADAWTLSEAITANNALGAGGAAGRRYNIKGAHTARGASDTISVGGTATSPTIWRGYNSTIGDLDAGTRDAYGVLDTTNYPDIGYNSTFRLAVSGNFTELLNLDIAGTRSGDILNSSANPIVIQNVRVVNSSTNASAIAIGVSSTTQIVNCDTATGASGGTASIDSNGTANIIGCRITAPGCAGIRVGSSARLGVFSSTIYGCGTDGILVNHASCLLTCIGVTIYGCTGDGIDFISTATATGHIIVGCHITDNGGYGFNANGGTSGAIATYSGNRTRDNTSGATSGYADWVAGTTGRDITTDAGAASTDYVDAATNKDFRLISTAAGYRQGFAYNANIGACGDNVTAGGGGGAMVIGG